MKTVYLYLFSFLASVFYAEAQKGIMTKIAPEHVKVQFAGNIGVLSVGTGYSFLSDKIQSDIFYGYAPARITGYDIHTLSLKNSFRLTQFSLSYHWAMTLSGGFGINYAITNNTFLFLPKQYPDEYYAPNAIHFAPFVSSNFIYKNDKNKMLDNFDVYFELGTLDQYIWYYFKERAFSFADIWNLAIGVRIPLTQ